MNTVSRTIAGLCAILVGLFVIYGVAGEAPEGWVYIVCWGLGITGVGIAIFFNKNEDSIEEIKNKKE